MSAAEERDFVHQLRMGDRRAFTKLVTLYQDRIFSYLYRMLGNRYEAEEVAQEVFIAAFRFIGGFRGECTIYSWLLRIASNMYKNKIRYLVSRKRSREFSLDDAYERSSFRPIGERPEDPESVMAGREAEVALELAVQELPEEFREVLVLRDVELMAYEEIQELTGLPEGTIKSRLHRARAQVARRMAARLGGKKEPPR